MNLCQTIQEACERLVELYIPTNNRYNDLCAYTIHTENYTYILNYFSESKRFYRCLIKDKNENILLSVGQYINEQPKEIIEHVNRIIKINEFLKDEVM